MTKTEYLIAPRQDDTGNPEHDLLLSMMRAIEERDGEQIGWDQAPQLFIASLIRPIRHDDPGLMQAVRVPHKQWLSSHDTVGALQLLSWAHPIPDRDAPHVEYADSPGGAAAVIYLAEAWSLIGGAATTSKVDRAHAGERFIYQDPERTEVRIVTAADINGAGYLITRVRGGEPKLTCGYSRADMFNRDPGGPGRALPALYRLANAARSGRFAASS